MKTTQSKKALQVLEQYNEIEQQVAKLNKQKKALRDEILSMSRTYGEQFKAGRFVAKVQTILASRFNKDLFIEKNGDDAYQKYTVESISEKITIKAA